MTTIANVTGQAPLIAEIDELLWTFDRPAVRLQGPSGSGKTWVAREVAGSWEAAGGLVLFATGDELCSGRSHFPLYLAVSSSTERAQSRAATNLALEPLNAIPYAGKSIRALLHQIFERKDVAAEARTPFLRQDDREILMRIQKAAARRRVLLVCDNLQWWDEASLQLLGLVLGPASRAAYSFLETVAILALQTTGGEGSESSTINALLTSSPWHSRELPLCTASAFEALLQAFGMRHRLPPELAAQLFAATGGHLELVRRIVDSETGVVRDSPGLVMGSQSDFLFSLLEQRLARHGSVPEDTVDALRAAAVIGTSFSDVELDCLLNERFALAGRPGRRLDHREDKGKTLDPAERLGIVERSGSTRTFTHDIVHKYYLQHSGKRREELHGRFAECLRLIHPGEYHRRADHSRRAGNERGAGELLVRDWMAAMRTGSRSTFTELRSSVDHDLGVFVEAMHDALVAFDAGRYSHAIALLEGIEALYPEPLLAERDILLARCHIKQLTRPDRELARVLLGRWNHLRDSEAEVWSRMMLYLTVACVFLGDEPGASEAERVLYEALSRRVSFDSTARRAINHVRLKSNMLHSAQVARERLRNAVAYFSGAEHVESYDPVHMYIGLVNLAANHVVEGEFDAANTCCHQAIELMGEERSVIFPREDILATNLTVAAYLDGQLDESEALRAALAIRESYRDSNDSPLHAANVGFYLARQGRYGEAIALLAPVFEHIKGANDFDSYYLYFVGNNLSGSLWMQGLVAESAAVWSDISPFVRECVGPMVPYMRARHAIQARIFESEPGVRDWDGFVTSVASAQVGPGWRFYGRGFLVSELEFWSDQ